MVDIYLLLYIKCKYARLLLFAYISRVVLEELNKANRSAKYLVRQKTTK